MTALEFRLPDVGEGLTEAEIVKWHVEPGQMVAVNDPLVDIETAKSVVELPSPHAGVVQLLAEPGQVIDVGAPIVRFLDATAEHDRLPTPAPTGAAAHGSAPAETAPARSPELDGAPAVPDSVRANGAPVDGSAARASGDDDKHEVLVGPGPKAAHARRRRLSAAPRPAGTAQAQAASAGRFTAPEPAVSAVDRPARSTPGAAGPATRASAGLRPRAKPPVRLLARRLGVDLQNWPDDGPISREDVERAAHAGPVAVGQDAGPQASPPADRESRVPIKGVRKATAQAMTRSAFTAPHVTEWLAVDMTETMHFVRDLKNDRDWSGVRVTPLLFVARAFLLAVASYPEINSRWDDADNEIVYMDYVNLGLAAATPRGLLVPNIKDAGAMDVRALAGAMDELVSAARAGKTQPPDMANGTVTITNIGALGVDAGTPILNPGEAAILAFGAVRRQPWVVGDDIRVREVTQLAMSFDHRLVDGDLGSRVLTRTAEVLADPRRAWLYL